MHKILKFYSVPLFVLDQKSVFHKHMREKKKEVRKFDLKNEMYFKTDLSNLEIINALNITFFIY